MERLQKVIARSGVASRRKAEELIAKGHVTVDGKLITELGYKVGPSQVISVDDVKINNEQKVYILLNKPRSVITSTKDDKGRATVVDLIGINERVYPVGRLDYDTTGALILTNDGDFANHLMHPRNKIEKVYMAKVDGIAKAEHIIPLTKGIKFEGEYYAPAKAKLRKIDRIKKTSMIEITITEGKNHQVKNMLRAVGLDVKKLKRERIGFLNLKGLKSGDYRFLNQKEVAKLLLEDKKR